MPENSGTLEEASMIEEGQTEQDESTMGQVAPPSEPSPPPPPPPPPPSSGLDGLPQTEKIEAERKALLANTLQGQVANGARIESQGDFQAVVVRGHRVNHLLHFLIGFLTLGFWWLVWIVIAITGGEKRQMISVDQFGNVFVQKV
ncbi:MAG TPA: hypothetical protein VKA35_07780 [Solirubrobacterales bacterium]|nr:hypothetical protein [Solirubrobacterales bacterium]